MGKHAMFSPSASHRWIHCPGSIALTHGLPQSSNESAIEGTMLHDVMEKHLRDGIPLDKFNLTDEQLVACQDCANWVKENLPSKRMFETKINFGYMIGQDKDDCFGTTDLMAYDEETKTLHVVDYKFGRNFVSPIENSQMQIYALGAYDAMTLIGNEVENISCNILQPRTGNQTSNGEYVISVNDLLNSAKRIATSAKEAKQCMNKSMEEIEKHLHPEEEACRFCLAASFCPALKKHAENAMLAMKEEFQTDTLDEGTINARVVLMSNDKLSKAMDMLPTLELLVKAVREESTKRALEGQTIPSYKLIEGRAGNRKWISEGEAIDGLHELGVENPYVEKLLSPADAETVVAKALGCTRKVAKEKIEALVTRSQGTPSLVRSESVGGTLYQVKATVEDFD